MSGFSCPVCGGPLIRGDRTLSCGKGHSFDLARQGYVNLLRSNRSSAKRHGDDRAMVQARTAFLEAGYYAPLREALCELALRYTGEQVKLLDVGCGEGWYTVGLKAALEEQGRTCTAWGIDISREALIQCARRDRTLGLAVASVNALPVPDGSMDLVLNVFAPNDDGEFHRCLRPGGVLLRAVPLEDHLLGLKEAVYDRPYRNPAPEYQPQGFTLLERREVRGRITLKSREEIVSLFRMTPYWYKTGREDQEKLDRLDSLETQIGFCIFCHRKQI